MTDSRSSAPTASMLTANTHTHTHYQRPICAERTGAVCTCACGGVGGGEGHSLQTQQLEEGGRLLVQTAQLPLGSRQVHAAQQQQLL